MLVSMFAALALGAGDPPSADKKTDDPIVCKKSKASVVGTRIKSPPVCKPKSEWSGEERDTKREMRQLMERATSPTPIPGGPR